MSAKEVFNYAFKYWSQIVVLASIPVAIVKIVLDRRTKREEIRYNGLLAIRNTEIKHYSNAVGVMFARLNTLPVVINTDDEKLEKLVGGLLAAHENLTSTYVCVSFFIPLADIGPLAEFNDTLSNICMAFIMLISKHLNNAITFEEFENQFKELRPTLDDSAKRIITSSQIVQDIIHKHIGVENQ
ncbi:hypothetical protein [Hymenobacter chitinivorans]|uniref:Uncharacterized protein n=1 Tax=Hymenobacter chitinivorans DSM 11115 TaxID=1121954 RepID=A0A2M9BNE0_9BACT|nr:hypothetical protein [Hymenobacter chitinivorans]PJJ59453.1 hypothetical protein CLV45_0870 [Hymenobacter chitinivorans DSM 11115]